MFLPWIQQEEQNVNCSSDLCYLTKNFNYYSNYITVSEIEVKTECFLENVCIWNISKKYVDFYMIRQFIV